MKYKLISWNVNGIRAVYKKGFLKFVSKYKPNILCLQETKAHENQLGFELTHIDNYSAYFNQAEKKGYSGVVTYSQEKPEKIELSIGKENFDREGRAVVTRYSNFVLYNVYFPNGKLSQARLRYKMDFYDYFYNLIKSELKTNKNIVICGDVNTAHKEIDLARPKENEKISGFLPEERAWIDKFLELGFIDSFRLFHQEKDKYTWWSTRTRARERNVGWRIDYFFVSKNLKKHLKSAEIHDKVLGSDHCPISIELNFN